MSKSLWIRLVLPLVFVSGLTFLISIQWPTQGLFMNLATEVIGILITVLYVDWVLRYHEKQRWQSTDLIITNRLQILLNATISSIRSGLGFGPDIFGEGLMTSKRRDEVHKELIRIAERVIYPSVYQRVCALDSKAWELLANQVANAHNGILTFFHTFQARMEPNQLSILLAGSFVA